MSFFVWIVYAFFFSRKIRHQTSSKNYKRPALQAAFYLLLAILSLVVGFYILTYFRMTFKNELSSPGWLIFLFLGLVFVRMQMMAAAILMHLFVQNKH